MLWYVLMIDINYLERNRIRRGVTQKEFATMLGLSVSGYVALLRRKTANPTTISKIVNRLMLDRSKLIPEPEV